MKQTSTVYSLEDIPFNCLGVVPLRLHTGIILRIAPNLTLEHEIFSLGWSWVDSAPHEGCSLRSYSRNLPIADGLSCPEWAVSEPWPGSDLVLLMAHGNCWLGANDPSDLKG